MYPQKKLKAEGLTDLALSKVIVVNDTQGHKENEGGVMYKRDPMLIFYISCFQHTLPIIFHHPGLRLHGPLAQSFFELVTNHKQLPQQGKMCITPTG